MLDPLSSLSLASSTISAVDFASKVIKTTVEIHHSINGTSITNQELEVVVLDLATVLDNLPTAPPSSASQSQDEVALKTLAASCKTLLDELLAALQELKPGQPHQRWLSIRKAIAGIWNERKIRDNTQRLNTLQNALATRLVCMLSYVSSLIEILFKWMRLATITSRYLKATFYATDLEKERTL